jgi:hypothetical protein
VLRAGSPTDQLIATKAIDRTLELQEQRLERHAWLVGRHVIDELVGAWNNRETREA